MFILEISIKGDISSMTIEEICSACINALLKKNYNKSTILNYEGVIRRFKQFCIERNFTVYSSKIGKAYADDVISKKTSININI